MLAMQYSIHLPRGYDDDLISKRVSHRSELFDGLDGMVHKSFLYNAKDKVYAPFYVWEDLQQARDFLLDDLFKGVIKSFNRPRVRDWVVLDHAYSNRAINPTFAIREIDSVPAEENLEEMLNRERRIQSTLMDNENLYYYLVALDPDRWELIRYHLWSNEDSAEHTSGDCIQTYDVLHVSEPNQEKVHDIADGPHCQVMQLATA